MNMPGFTAEVSLKNSGKHYSKMVAGTTTRFQTVQPALPRRPNLQGHSKCIQQCGSLFDTLEGNVACNDYCDCLYLTDNSWFTCLVQTVTDRL